LIASKHYKERNMKKISILTTLLFALGLYMVPAIFATAATDSKDKQTRQGEYQRDQPGQSQVQPAQQTPGALGQPSRQEQQTQPGQQAQQPQRGAQDQQARLGQQSQQQQNLMLVDNLIGKEIQNRQGEKIGDIDKVLIDVDSGQVGFVTMTSGGVFGIGENKYIIPFNALEKRMPQGTQARAGERQMSQVVFTLDKQKDQLKEVEGDIEEFMTQAGQTRGIHEHYGVSPYWEDSQRQQQRPGEAQRPGAGQEKR
jgi:sporulation protein YlmC with PRC-barrel domain